MTDWHAVAQARGVKISESEIERMAEALRRLEEVLQPVVHDLPHSLDPAITFRADPGDTE
jgi:hypothetical protein